MDLFTAGVNYSLLPAQFASQFLIVAVTDLAISFKSKNKKTKLTCRECAISAIVGGVMEPSIFGIYMKFQIDVSSMFRYGNSRRNTPYA